MRVRDPGTRTIRIPMRRRSTMSRMSTGKSASAMRALSIFMTKVSFLNLST
ncbi:hypothetical protein R80B4_02526 [Fibrobacteres bacterium R8-0-B4]